MIMQQIEKKLLEVKRDPLPQRSEKEILELSLALLAKMTLKEKIGQLVQSGTDCSAISGPSFDASKTVDDICNGMVGSILGTHDDRFSFNLQQKALSSRLGIPLIFCADIIHGCRTSFPINLAMSGSFDLELIEEASKIAAYESAHAGVDLVFSPMLDLVRDPRWGRVMESNGEDVYLSKKIATSYVRGYQQETLASYDSVACCLKHFCVYGAAEGGREYNTIDVSLNSLHNDYLPPFKAGIDAGASMVMSSFNVFNGVPVTVNKYLLRDVLRDELGFKGVVISDYTSSGETMAHKVCLTEKEVAKKSILAGLDHEMISPTYAKYLEELVLEGEVSETLIDEACLRILKLKYALGLFDNPFKHLYLNNDDYFKSDKALNTALKMSEESIVMLENKNSLLPLDEKVKIALIGPYANTVNLVGAWGGKCDRSDNETLLAELTSRGYNVKYALGCDEYGDYYNLEEVKEVVKDSDIILFACGEGELMSGEASSRAFLNLTGRQDEMLAELNKLGKKIVMLVHAGRPLIMRNYKMIADGILYCWYLGIMSSKAIVNTLFGYNNPSAKLTMSFPYCEGQIPVYYNNLPTGRPNDINKPNEKYFSKYIDIPNEPLYKFGYGLSYSKFKYSNLNYTEFENYYEFTVDITNVSNVSGTEIALLFINPLCASISLANRNLKAFKRVKLNANECKTISLILEKEELKYYNNGSYETITSDIEVYVGTSLDDNIKMIIKR